MWKWFWALGVLLFASTVVPAKAQDALQYLNITASTTTTVKTGSGRLRAIVVNTKGAAGAAVIFDSTTGTGTKIGSIDTNATAGTFYYEAQFVNGLTIVTTGAPDITVVYR